LSILFYNLIAMYLGGFGGNVNHDPHLLYTLSAVQILVVFDALDKLNIAKVVQCMCINLPFVWLLLTLLTHTLP